MPGAVALTANGAGDCNEVALDWSSYDEAANGGDIREYRIYRSVSPFNNIANATQITMQSGKSYRDTGLACGQTYYYAVVAYDVNGLHLEEVSPISATTTDTVAPAEITKPVVGATLESISISWTASTAADIASYNIYFNNEAQPQNTTTTTYSKGSLAAATAYPVKITAVDTGGNESTGVTVEAVTLLQNPASLTAEALSGMAELSWSAATPATLVKNYLIYKSETPITDLTGMTPAATIAADKTTGRVAGLNNGTTYYFTVTTVNKSAAENRTVAATTSATPEADTRGPQLSDLQYSGVAIGNGSVIGQNGIISLKATDQSGISNLTIQIDGGAEIPAQANGETFSIDWDIEATTDGEHTITINAEDTLGNQSEPLVTTVTVTLATPAAPQIDSPANNHKTNNETVNISGTAKAGTTVL